MGKLAAVVLEGWGVINATPRAYWTIRSGEETHPLISYIMVSVMASIIIGASLSEPHHRRSTVKSVFLLASLLDSLLASSLIWMIAV